MDEYLCAICSEPCLDEVHDTIQCSNCHNLVHNTCSNLSKLNLKQWSADYLQFLCKCCAFDGPEYNSAAALDRLRLAMASTNKSDLLNQAKSEGKLLETYDVRVPIHDSLLYNTSQVHQDSVQILNMFHPVMNIDYYPLQTVGDGNCLYRAELSGPTDPRQVRDMKRRQDMKERRQAGLTGSRQNIADHITEIENKVSRNDPFIRSVIRQNGKAPCIILYNDEQIQDLKQLCCTGKTVLGVDKTFNLCDMHVTVTCYKQLSVTKVSTSEPPLFIGPIFIHDNSDFDTYCTFFLNLKVKLNDVDSSNLVLGTDDERALVNAIKVAFPQAHHILCTRHLRQNANQKLTDDAVDKYDKKTILDKIFGDDGLLQADDTICFEEKCEELETVSQSISKNFLRYFQKRLKDIVREKRKDPEVAVQSDKMWTNNNCESLNHVLKQAIDWKSKPLLDFINYVSELVDAQFKDLKRALVSTGQFRLAESYSQFAVSKSVWANKTDDERNRLFRRFRSHTTKNPRLVKSTDGHSDVVAPRTKGQKIGQRKRKRTERTTIVTVKKTIR